MNTFASRLSAVLFAAVIVAFTGCTGKENNVPQPQPQTKKAATPMADKLKATPVQVEGPYFIANSPWRDNLIPAGMTGTEIKVSGKVFGTDGAEVKDATIHVWLADPNGSYDNQDKDGSVVVIPESKQKLRGRIKADANAGYSFSCLRPGNYEIEDGKMRPAHIHIRVEAPGYRTLITQLYFADDPWNTKDIPGDKFFQPELIVPLTAGATKEDPQTGKFDFVLRK